MTKANTLREHLQRAIIENCDLWVIWSEWCGEETWQKTKDKHKDNYKDHDKYITWLVSLCEIVDISDSWEPEFMTIKSDTGQHSQFLRCFLKQGLQRALWMQCVENI